MRITVHRGTDQIGGCVTEYESNGWKLFVDYGEQLPSAPTSDKSLEIEGLTYGDLRKSALLITRYHGDLIGKIADLPPEMPIFMGNKNQCLENANTFVAGEQFNFGDFEIMPIVTDHPAFETYAFRIAAKGLKVFHTGYFRTYGFQDSELPQIIENHIGKVDYVVCDAIDVDCPDTTSGQESELLHTGGHCDMASLDRLLDMLKPKAIIPIHTDNPQRFADLFCEKLPVILFEDGESFNAICDSGFDTTSAKVMAFQEPDNSCEVIENPENLQWWMVDDKFLGEFQWWNDADFALHHVVYAPQRLIGYTIESDEDMAPWLYVVFNPDFTEHSEYNEGEHEPGGNNYQEEIPFAPGERVLAIIDDLLIPCEVVGPVTVDFLREEYNNWCGDSSEEEFQEYLERLWDWDWDKVVVRPLVKIKTKFGEISSDTTAQRIYIFPYKTLSTNENTPSL